MPTAERMQAWVMMTGKRGGKYYLSRSGKKIYKRPGGAKPKAPRIKSKEEEPEKILKPDQLKTKLTKSGKRMYEGVDSKLIKHVATYKNHPSGLRAVIHRNDGGKPIYKYESAAKEARARRKFARAQKMGKELPKVRKEVEKDLTSSDPRTRAAATVTKLIDDHYIRNGGSAAEKKTGSSGASSLRARHVHPNHDGTVNLKFKGKSGVQWNVKVTDPKVAKNLKDFAEGKSADDRLFPTNASAVNKYIKGKLPGTTAKDFRTYHAGRLAYSELKAMPKPKSKKEAKANIAKAVKSVASRLGHTPTVCKDSYINPHILEQYMEAA